MKSIDEYVISTIKIHFKVYDLPTIISNKLLVSMKLITGEILSHIRDNGGNLREAVRLEQAYKNEYAYLPLKNMLITRYIDFIEQTGNLEMLPELFSDVYADLFALSMTGQFKAKTPKDYIVPLFEHAGASIYDWLNHEGTLLRLMIVAKAVGWNVSDKIENCEKPFVDILLDILKIKNNAKKNNVRNMWKELYDLPYRKPISEYADICKIALENKVSSIENDREFTAIQSLWEKGDNIYSDIVPDIYTLWYYLMNPDTMLMKGLENEAK
jgi:hypothetical protein